MGEKSIFKILATGLVFSLMLACSNTTSNSTDTSTVNNSTDTVIQVLDSPKSKDEIIGEVAGNVADITGKIIENHQKKTAELIANKEEIWAYQIGLPFDDVDELSENFDKLRDIKDISVFEGKESYLIIKMVASKEILDDSLGSFKAQINQTDVLNKKVTPINLSGKCKAKEYVQVGKGRKLKKNHNDIPCYICN